MRKTFEIRERMAEIPYKDRSKIDVGITLDTIDGDADVVASYATLADAEKDLANRKSGAKVMRGTAFAYILVEEFYIEENSYDDDDEWVSGSDPYKFADGLAECMEEINK